MSSEEAARRCSAGGTVEPCGHGCRYGEHAAGGRLVDRTEDGSARLDRCRDSHEPRTRDTEWSVERARSADLATEMCCQAELALVACSRSLGVGQIEVTLREIDGRGSVPAHGAEASVFAIYEMRGVCRRPDDHRKHCHGSIRQRVEPDRCQRWSDPPECDLSHVAFGVGGRADIGDAGRGRVARSSATP